MSHQEQKRFRIEWLINKINSQGILSLCYAKDKLLAEFCSFFGASLRLAPEYLKELELNEKIYIINKKVYSADFFNKDGSIKNESEKIEQDFSESGI